MEKAVIEFFKRRKKTIRLTCRYTVKVILYIESVKVNNKASKKNSGQIFMIPCILKDF